MPLCFGDVSTEASACRDRGEARGGGCIFAVCYYHLNIYACAELLEGLCIIVELSVLSLMLVLLPVLRKRTPILEILLICVLVLKS